MITLYPMKMLWAMHLSTRSLHFMLENTKVDFDVARGKKESTITVSKSKNATVLAQFYIQK